LLWWVVMRPRLSRLESAALTDLAASVRTALGHRLVGLTLFGSRARGEGREDSDLDVLVLVQKLSRGDRRVVQDLTFDVGLAHHLILSPLIADAAAWRTDLPLGRAIAGEGIPL
jgi:predicted nucleotidyltransferase